MKEILYNPDNLSSKDIDEVIIRTKGLIINSIIGIAKYIGCGIH